MSSSLWHATSYRNELSVRISSFMSKHMLASETPITLQEQIKSHLSRARSLAIQWADLSAHFLSSTRLRYKLLDKQGRGKPNFNVEYRFPYLLERYASNMYRHTWTNYLLKTLYDTLWTNDIKLKDRQINKICLLTTKVILHGLPWQESISRWYINNITYNSWV